jgi:hypothetical protein
MRFLPSPKTVRRAEARAARRFFKLMGLVTLVFALIVAIHYVLGCAQTIENFLSSNGDEVEIRVKNVTLDELKTPPYKATVDFEKVYYGQGGRQERKRETFVAQVNFVLRDQIPKGFHALRDAPIEPVSVAVVDHNRQ